MQSFTTGKQCIATECNTTENNTVAYETTLRMEMEHKADLLEWYVLEVVTCCAARFPLIT